MDTETRKQQELESKLKTKGHELEESQKRLDKLEDHIRVSKVQLDEQEKMASGKLFRFQSVLNIYDDVASFYTTKRYSLKIPFISWYP